MAPKILYPTARKLFHAFVSFLFVLFLTSLGEGLTDPTGEANTAAQLHAERNKFFNQGRNHDAVTVWLKEFSLDPKNANTANNIGIAYRRLGQLDLAIEYHKKTVELNPEFGHGYHGLGLAHYDRKENEQAGDAFLWQSY